MGGLFVVVAQRLADIPTPAGPTPGALGTADVFVSPVPGRGRSYESSLRINVHIVS